MCAFNIGETILPAGGRQQAVPRGRQRGSEAGGRGRAGCGVRGAERSWPPAGRWRGPARGAGHGRVASSPPAAGVEPAQ